MANSRLRLVLPNTVNGTVPPRRQKNSKLRTREYLTEAEVDRLIKAAKTNRYGKRDATMILMAFRHGLRAAELVDLRWEQVDLGRNAGLHVRRVKKGIAATHPLQGDEMRALRELKRKAVAVRVCLRAWRALHRRVLRRWSRGSASKAGFKYRVHPHMLRHACGYALANKGHDTRALQAYLGHRQHSAHGSLYRTEPGTFQGLLERLAQTTSLLRCSRFGAFR